MARTASTISGSSSSGTGGRAYAAGAVAISRGNGSSDGALMNSAPRMIEGTYREARGWGNSYYKDEILEATTDGNGNLTFNYAAPVAREKTAKTNRTQYLTYEVAHGAQNGDTFGINLDNVNSIRGQTYSLRKAAKDAGLKWDPAQKIWRRK